MPWVRVKRGTQVSKCPVCGSPDWCCVTQDGIVANCMRVKSDNPAKNGGWIHRIDGKPLHVQAKTRPEKPIIDMSACYRGLLRDAKGLATLSEALGVTTESLDRLGARWARIQSAWGFPMRSPDGTVVGVRLRYPDGKKRSITGGREGLFVPDGAIPESCTEIMVCEGPTDAAAALDLGFYAIGRPSCRGSVEFVQELCRGCDVIIMGDNDRPKTLPDGTQWCPGQEGAEALARALRGIAHSVKLILPLVGKDIREWLQHGATQAMIRAILANTGGWK